MRQGNFRRQTSALLLAVLLSATLALAQHKYDSKLEEFNDIAVSDEMLMAPMRDGVKLATNVYYPKNQPGPFPVIFVKTPYLFGPMTEDSVGFALEAVKRGYAYVVQNERGRYYSQGDWVILGDPARDGYDSLTWIAAQKWSNGRVGTYGCSSTAEWQMELAAQSHPAHKAMIPMAAGAGIGRVGEFYEQGNLYKGGVFQTLFAIWLYGVQADLRPQFPPDLTQEQLRRVRTMWDLNPKMPPVEWKKHVRTLPVIDWLKSAGANDGPFTDLLARKPNDPKWYTGGLYHDDQDFGVPAYWFNSWFDISQGPNLALFNHVREKASKAEVRDGQFVLIAPTLHCAFSRIPKGKDLIVGELNVGRAYFDVDEQVFGFFDYYLKGAQNGFPGKTPRVRYYTMGRNEWESSSDWPPKDAALTEFFLASGGSANSVFGNGTLQPRKSEGAASDSFTYDPTNPVPSLGGGVCCNAGVTLGGSYDQREIEARADVLVYTSEPLKEPMQITGSIRPILYVSSDARDTDFSVKLVDVYPDGTAYNIDDTILRARYREGYEKEVFMQPGQVYELKPTPMSTSYEFLAGHRIRVEVSSSKFPQYMRNLNTGGNNWDETKAVTAHNTLHHSSQYPSRIVLPVIKRR